MTSATESTPLLPSFHSTHRKHRSAFSISTVPRAFISFLTWVFASLIRQFILNAPESAIPTTASPPSAQDSANHETPLNKAEKTTSRKTLAQESSLVVVARSELPTATYPLSSLKKAPSCDSMLQMKEKSVRFSAIIDIHEFSRLAGEPFGMVQPSKAPGVKTPRMNNGLEPSERTRLTLELEPAPMKSSYNPRLIDDDNDYSSRSRYD